MPLWNTMMLDMAFYRSFASQTCCIYSMYLFQISFSSIIEMVQCNQPPSRWLTDHQKCCTTYWGHCWSLLLADVPPSNSCHQVGLGEWKSASGNLNFCLPWPFFINPLSMQWQEWLGKRRLVSTEEVIQPLDYQNPSQLRSLFDKHSWDYKRKIFTFFSNSMKSLLTASLKLLLTSFPNHVPSNLWPGNTPFASGEFQSPGGSWLSFQSLY